MVSIYKSRRRGRPATIVLTDEPPDLELRHSVAVDVLARMGFQGPVSEETFNGYVKSLRKLGIPFTLGETRPGAWLAMYGYAHLMELAVALSLRCYNIAPDAVLSHLIDIRPELNKLYVEAWRQCAKTPLRPLAFRSREGSVRVPRGPFLDIQMRQAGREFQWEGPPRLISTGEALELYGAAVATAFVPGPIRISALVHRMAAALEGPL